MRDQSFETHAWEWGGRIRRHVATAVATVVAASLVAPGVAAAQTQAVEYSGPPTSVIVREHAGAGTAPETAVEAVGGSVGRHIDIIDGFLATVPEDAVAAIEARPDVLSVTENRRVRLSAYDGFDPKADPGSMLAAQDATGAAAYWNAGITGAGVDVAVIDSGVSPVNGLLGYRKVAQGPDFSFETFDRTTRHVDTFGHGTHMAGIIAGRDSGAPRSIRAGESRYFVGMAPDARIVNMKVADRYGFSDVVQVLLAMDWVVKNRNRPGFNIRVMNLSFGTDSTQDYRLDPLTYAAEVAWHAGIVVVVAGGNAGDGTPQLNDPAYDPYVLAVGASDAHGTADISDDTVASFSSRGSAERRPDLVAPGKSVVSLRAAGSLVEAENPEALVGTRLLRGSGTSQAAAVVSGAAALVAQQRPRITPDQMKALLMDSAQLLPDADVRAQGAGALDLRDAFSRPTPNRVQTWERATGQGSLELARGSDPLNGTEMEGVFEAIYAGDYDAVNGLLANRWSANRWSANRWSANRWSANRWSANRWSSGTWN